MRIIENLDAISNLNNMTKREIIYDLVKSTHDLQKSCDLLRELEQSSVIKFEINHGEQELIHINSPFQKQKTDLVNFEELNQILEERSKSPVETTTQPSNLLSPNFSDKYSQLKHELHQ